MADITNCSKNYISHNYSVRVYFLSVSAYNFLPFYYLTSLQCQGYETFTCTIYLSRFEYGSSRVFYCNYSTQIKWYDGSNMIIPMFNFERFIIMNSGCKTISYILTLKLILSRRISQVATSYREILIMLSLNDAFKHEIVIFILQSVRIYSMKNQFLWSLITY